MTEEDKAKMDAAAEVARGELAPIVAKHPDAVQEIGAWWQKHFGPAGHKRLGRIIANLA